VNVFSLPQSGKLLTALGLVGRDGRVSGNGQRKLKQVQGMLPWLLGALQHTRPARLEVVEFGCGKGYLSFFLASACRELGLGPVLIRGVDREPSHVAVCRSIGEGLGWGELQFAVETCEGLPGSSAPALVTALHACDVATDHVLAAGIAWGAEHIIVAPCCQFTTQRTLRQAGHRHDWGYLARSFPVLGSRLSEFLTDGMRCLCLRAHGYDVQVREFVSGTATPKNQLLIARRTGHPGRRARDELRRLERTLALPCEVHQSLARRATAKDGSEVFPGCCPDTNASRTQEEVERA
jgi:hypothetical protein